MFGFFGTGPAGENQPGTTTPDAWAYGFVVAAAVAVAIRRRWPLPALALATAATAPYLIQGYPYGPILLSFAIAVYTVAGEPAAADGRDRGGDRPGADQRARVRDQRPRVRAGGLGRAGARGGVGRACPSRWV